MAKAKYKIGQLAQVKDDQGNIFGEITGITTFKTGYNYILEGGKLNVNEDQIEMVYAPIKTKTARRSSPRKTAKISKALQPEATM